MTAPAGPISGRVITGALHHIRNPDIARRLWSLCKQAGFSSVDGGPTLFVGRDYTPTYRAANHALWLEELVRKGDATQSDADAWITQMWEMNASGEFRSATSVFDVVAVM
jgi:hypothetical protein